MLTTPLFANQLSGIQIKEVVFFVLVIFIFLLTRIITRITTYLQSLYCVLIFTLSLFFRFLSRIF